MKENQPESHGRHSSASVCEKGKFEIEKLSLKEEVARLAKSYRFKPAQQERLSELLYKNKEGMIQPQEEEELDALIEELDRRKLQLAAKIEKLAHR
jgi:hypothetical protein